MSAVPSLGPVEPVAPVGATVGEAPVWDPAGGALLWVDVLAGHLHRFDPGSGRDDVTDAGRHLGAVLPRAGGGLVAATRGGIALWPGTDPAPDTRVVLGRHERMNDAACDAAGRLWAGSITYAVTPGSGRLHRMDPGGEVTEVRTGLTMPNGIGWSPDGSLLYLVDSGAGTVYAYDFDAAAGVPANPRPLVAVPAGDGLPDGLAVDREGHLWIALWGGGRLLRVDPDGRPVGELRLPTTNVTSCAFGGPDADQLYITTARYGLTTAQLRAEPLAGALFRCAAPVPGAPTHPFGG